MKVAIIGAGWYGCHLATVLKKYDIEIDIYEKESEIFQQASSKNQNRLHLGFHYPRSFLTRDQSKEGYKKFFKLYGDFCFKVEKNIYSVDNRKSLIDFETYVAIMESAKLDFKVVEYPFKIFSNLDGFIETNEMVIDFDLAKKYFEKELEENLILNTAIIESDIQECKKEILISEKAYDYIINCTWGTFKPFNNVDIFYEPCVSFLYKTHKRNFALTIMDGEFISIYPYNNNLYTLTSVKNTPLAKYKNMREVNIHLDSLVDKEILDIRNKIEKETLYYYPKFLEDFSYNGYYTSIKTKLNVKNDCRQVIVESRGREVYVLPGKIDTIFYAEEKLLNILGLK
jgi:hypothetical protein